MNNNDCLKRDGSKIWCTFTRTLGLKGLIDLLSTDIFLNTYNCESIERVQRKFLKIVLGLYRSTPNVMLYGETGRHSLIDSIQLRQVNFWGKLVDNNGIPKISQEIYHLMLNFQQKTIMSQNLLPVLWISLTEPVCHMFGNHKDFPIMNG